MALRARVATELRRWDRGLEVCAGGVETKDSRRQLLALGCEWAQGYLISRPDLIGFQSGFGAGGATFPTER